MLFTDLPLCDSLLDGLQSMNFKETTPVQEQAIPVILQKKDVIACAQTGTGKTAAFLLPLLNNLQTESHDDHKVKAIIMAPTRELAQQIDQQMEGFSYFTPFSSVAVYGGNDGEAWDVQKRGLTSGADVVVATPGRLLSHINLYNIDFSGVKYFILDEADRMLDMGFFDDIMKIEKLLPKERQTIMFSATMPPKIQQLAKTILRDPEEISISITRPPDTIMQSVYLCYEPQKMQILRQLFKEKKPRKVILFSGSKMKVKEIAKLLSGMGLSAGEMHSDLDQAQRDSIMHEFRNERVDILVATDIVARGIDIDDITLVINFEVPYDVEDYVHRIGRTARAGDTGMAITFVSPDEQYRLQQIERFLEKEVYRIPLPEGMGEAPEYNPSRESRGRGRGASGRSGKGGKREGGKRREDGSGKKAERTERTERTERADGTERAERPERSGRGRKPKKAEGATPGDAAQGDAAALQAEAATPGGVTAAGDAATGDAAATEQKPRRKNNNRRKKRKPQGDAAANAGEATERGDAPRQEGDRERKPRREGDAPRRRKPQRPRSEGENPQEGGERAPRKEGEGGNRRRSNRAPREGGEGAPRRERGEKREGGSREGRRTEGSDRPRSNRPPRRSEGSSTDRGTGRPERPVKKKPAEQEQKTKKPGILSWLFGRKK
ncbi:DEAD/DEAH box helicase [Dysgonomonadaceae bacterium zrk40]|nr:DEAD/DEAH box helicase [Dysgonomonadaceae bacterium zrk40]